jgi:hypothetical protein
MASMPPLWHGNAGLLSMKASSSSIGVARPSEFSAVAVWHGEHQWPGGNNWSTLVNRLAAAVPGSLVRKCTRLTLPLAPESYLAVLLRAIPATSNGPPVLFVWGVAPPEMANRLSAQEIPCSARAQGVEC